MQKHYLVNAQQETTDNHPGNNNIRLLSTRQKNFDQKCHMIIIRHTCCTDYDLSNFFYFFVYLLKMFSGFWKKKINKQKILSINRINAKNVVSKLRLDFTISTLGDYNFPVMTEIRVFSGFPWYQNSHALRVHPFRRVFFRTRDQSLK